VARYARFSLLPNGLINISHHCTFSSVLLLYKLDTELTIIGEEKNMIYRDLRVMLSNAIAFIC